MSFAAVVHRHFVGRRRSAGALASPGFITLYCSPDAVVLHALLRCRSSPGTPPPRSCCVRPRPASTTSRTAGSAAARRASTVLPCNASFTPRITAVGCHLAGDADGMQLLAESEAEQIARLLVGDRRGRGGAVRAWPGRQRAFHSRAPPDSAAWPPDWALARGAAPPRTRRPRCRRFGSFDGWLVSWRVRYAFSVVKCQRDQRRSPARRAATQRRREASRRPPS